MGTSSLNLKLTAEERYSFKVYEEVSDHNKSKIWNVCLFYMPDII
ncbi:hypothetical protein [Clostridium amylolyticum]|nr:hypothetical protein [Clostridium amylolyticum]